MLTLFTIYLHLYKIETCGLREENILEATGARGE